jgi:hypothetical protein
MKKGLENGGLPCGAFTLLDLKFYLNVGKFHDREPHGMGATTVNRDPQHGGHDRE